MNERRPWLSFHYKDGVGSVSREKLDDMVTVLDQVITGPDGQGRTDRVAAIHTVTGVLDQHSRAHTLLEQGSSETTNIDNGFLTPQELLDGTGKVIDNITGTMDTIEGRNAIEARKKEFGTRRFRR